MNKEIKIGDILETNNFGKIKIISEEGYKNNKLSFKVEFLNSGNFAIFDKYAILKGSIQDTDYIYKRILGEIRNSNSFGPFKILELVTKSRRVYYKIEFLNTGYQRLARKDSIDSGRVCDYSIFKDKEYKNRCKNIWYKIKERNKNKNILISKEWFESFENFEKWYYKNKYENYLEIDKDILSILNNNGILKYSSETCLLIPAEINCEFVNLHNFPSVHYKNNKYKIKFDCKLLKLENYWLENENLDSLILEYLDIIYKGLKIIIDKYKSILPIELYNKLYNFDNNDLNKFKKYIINYKLSIL